MATSPITDSDLRRLLLGEKSAWDRFVASTASLLHAMIYRTLRQYRGHVQSGETEDILQDIYVKLLKNDKALLRRYDPARAALTTWLSLIARTTTIDALRRSKSHVPLNEAVTIDPSPRDDPLGGTIDLPRDLLSGRQALVLRLLYDKEMEPDEVADFLGIEVQTVRSTKHKAIEKLRKYYKETG